MLRSESLENSVFMQTRKTAKPAEIQNSLDRAFPSCMVMDGNMSLLGERLSAKLAPMTTCQETLLTEYLNLVSKHRRDSQSILAKLAADRKGLQEKKILDRKAIERDLTRRYEELESALNDAQRVVQKRLALVEDTEYDLKYKQAR